MRSHVYFQKNLYSPTSAVAVIEQTVVDADVLENLDDRQGRAGQDGLDGASGRLVGGGRLGVDGLSNVRGGKRAEGNGGDEADAGVSILLNCGKLTCGRG